MNQDFFVFSSDEDGISMARYDHQTLLQALEQGDFGENVTFISDINSFTGYFSSTDEDSLLIIKGEIVKPEPVEVVTRWEFANS